MQNKKKEIRDSEIICQVISGDINAFEILMERYQAYVFTVVRKRIPPEEADEIVHDIFIRAYQGLPRFSGKGEFKQWLSGIAVRACYDFWRKKYRSKEVPLANLTDAHRQYMENRISAEAFRHFESEKERTENEEILNRILSNLSAAERMVIELVYFEGLSHKEAAALLGWRIANIKVRVHRAKKKICSMFRAQKKG